MHSTGDMGKWRDIEGYDIAAQRCLDLDPMLRQTHLPWLSTTARWSNFRQLRKITFLFDDLDSSVTTLTLERIRVLLRCKHERGQSSYIQVGFSDLAPPLANPNPDHSLRLE